MWKKIEGMEIEVNELGEVRNSKSEKLIKQYSTRSGYVLVNASYTNGKRTSISVHRLMAKAFFNVETNRKRVVNHIDGDKSNNKLSNLEIISAKENIEHAYRLGLNKGSSLNAEMVRQIRKLREEEDPKFRPSIRELAKIFNISSSTVQQIVSRRTWKHVE